MRGDKGGGKSGGAAAAGGRARKKREKGGERSFVTSLEEMSIRDTLEEQKQRARKARRDDGEDDDDDDDEDSDDDEDDSEEEDANGGVTFERVQTNSLFGFSQKADGPVLEKEKKPKGIAAIVKVENPNKMNKQNKMVKMKNIGDQAPVEQQLSRREREAIEKEAAAARYLKKHLAGETEEAKKDLARLAEVRRRREEAEKRKKEEEQIAAEREAAKKKLEKKEDDEILDARAIKALKPNVLKEKLKERGLSTQGQKKDLIQRLIDYEDERAL
ncbi:hypothetical protein PINS_up004397 [Pythium insidiosum]|nr:hypothetical protein PINS_up004397 [Pythium insidiosum]